MLSTFFSFVFRILFFGIVVLLNFFLYIWFWHLIYFLPNKITFRKICQSFSEDRNSSINCEAYLIKICGVQWNLSNDRFLSVSLCLPVNIFVKQFRRFSKISLSICQLSNKMFEKVIFGVVSSKDTVSLHCTIRFIYVISYKIII